MAEAQGQGAESAGGRLVRVARADEIAPGERKIVECEGRSIGVFNLGGETVISLIDLAKLLVDVNGGGEFEIHELGSAHEALGPDVPAVRPIGVIQEELGPILIGHVAGPPVVGEVDRRQRGRARRGQADV